MTGAEAKARRALALDKRRGEQQACAYDFLTRPGHEARCVCAPACSRTYDPAPDHYDARDEPMDHLDYAGTGIGALYGLGSDWLLAETAGWTIVGLNDGSPVPLGQETT